MWPWLRRLLWLVAVVSAAAVGYAAWDRRRASALAPPGAPEWPPFEPDAVNTEAIVTDPAPVSTPEVVAPPGAARWVPPVDGTCPDGYPVKVKLASGIFHVPGGRSYERTRPDRCYASADDAEADGYRAARS